MKRFVLSLRLRNQYYWQFWQYFNVFAIIFFIFCNPHAVFVFCCPLHNGEYWTMNSTRGRCSTICSIFTTFISLCTADPVSHCQCDIEWHHLDLLNSVQNNNKVQDDAQCPVFQDFVSVFSSKFRAEELPSLSFQESKETFFKVSCSVDNQRN